MTSRSPRPQAAETDPRAARAERLAEALRANLQRRKDQERARRDPVETGDDRPRIGQRDDG